MQLRLGLPLQLQRASDHGKCEGGWTWQVDRGTYGDVRLDGLCFSVYANWPGAIHEGNGEALILLDERADASQRAALETLLGGKVGGPWEMLGWTWPKVHGPYAVAYDLVFDGDSHAREVRRVRRSRMRTDQESRDAAPNHTQPSSCPKASSSNRAIWARRRGSACHTALPTITRVNTWRSVRSSTPRDSGESPRQWPGRRDPDHPGAPSGRFETRSM